MAMELRNILVNLDIDFYTPGLLDAAKGLAERFGARLSAVAAATPAAELIAVEGAALTVGVYEAERAEVERRLHQLEAAFNDAVPAQYRDRSWAILNDPTRELITAGRRTDLVMVQSHNRGQEVASRNVDVGSLLLALGRPVLLMAAEPKPITAKTIVVGWKDSRESRRAVADAMPLLRTARDVMVVALEEGGDRTEQKASLGDLVGWLQLHEVKARGDIYPVVGSHGETLAGIARRSGSDLIVTGAYAHSRLRQWLFGGVTRDLLGAASVNRFMSN
jgi:nucleotide-binding universal stress UspA family protein